MNHICLLNACKGLKDFREGITGPGEGAELRSQGVVKD